MIRRILRFTSIVVLGLSSLVAAAQPSGQVVEGVAAVVGKNIILKTEVDQQYEAYQRQVTTGPDLNKCQVFDEMLFQKLLVHHAEVDSIMVSDEEVDGNMDRRLQQLIGQMGGDSKKLEEYYGKSIIEIKEEMRPLMKEQLTAQRMQGSITLDLEVTPTEVQEFYNSIPEDSLPLINTEVELAQILRYPEVSQEAVDETIQRLKDLKERIENGSSFSSMAILYSEDPGSNKNGGEYKGIKRGQFVKEFEAVAFNLKKNEVSDPFKTEYGYHICQLLEKRGEEIDLRHILIKPKLSQDDLDETEAFLDSLYNMIIAEEITWEEAASEYSEDEQTKFNGGVMSNFETGEAKFEISQLDRYTFNSIQELKEGEVSEPSFYRTFDQKEAFRLVKLIKRIEPHKANLKDDYQRIKGFALQKKQADTMEEWELKKIKETYIKINPSYFECEVDQKWFDNKAAN